MVQRGICAGARRSDATTLRIRQESGRGGIHRAGIAVRPDFFVAQGGNHQRQDREGGDKFGEAQVVSIAEGEVILRTGKDKQVLKLYPSLYKPGPDSRAGASPDSPTKGK